MNCYKIEEIDEDEESSIRMAILEEEDACQGSSWPSQLVASGLEQYQNVNQFIRHLPHFEMIRENAHAEFELIKANLAKSIALNELRPGLVHWTNRLQTFINEYGLFFNKTDHIKLIKIYLSVIATPQIDLTIVDLCFSILIELLKKYQCLSRNDLVIEWRSIYELYIKINKVDERSSIFAPENIESISFLNFVSFARIYFDKQASREILAELRPLMCPFDMSMNSAMERLSLFLPTLFLETESDQINYLKEWVQELLDIWLLVSGKAIWETHLISLLSRAAKDTMGKLDWGPYIPYVFSKTLRGLGLSLATELSLNIDDNTPKEALSLMNSLADPFTYNEADIDTIGSWIVAMIGNSSDRNMCMDHLRSLLVIIRSYFYPSNSGSLDNFFCLLQRLPEALIERVRYERLNKIKWLKYEREEESYISSEDIEDFVLILRPICLTAIFSKTNFNDAIKAFQYLCFLRPDMMLPVLMDRISCSFELTAEPHRYTPMLACLTSVPRELVSYYNAAYHSQKYVIQLLLSVLPGIDINDLNKFILTFQFLTNVCNHIILCDCSPAVSIRSDLNEYERDICYMTRNFDDFIGELFKKLFDFIDHIANDTSTESSVSASAMESSVFARNNLAVNDVNVTKVHVLQMLKVLINQSSRSILRQIVNKVFKFVSSRSFSMKAGDIIACLCGYLVSSGYGKEAFYKFFDHAYSNLMHLKEGKNFNNLLQCEKSDSSIKWNLHLLSYLLKADGLVLVREIPRIKEVLSWYKPTINKECISHMTACFNNLIGSLTKFYPKEMCSVGYSIIFDNEIDFFSKHLPIRDWGTYIPLNELNFEYHIPNKEEISAGLDLVSWVLNESMTFLKRSMGKSGAKIVKEEVYRELNYIYHVVYGSSCLLKRPARQLITEHYDSKVEIGIKDGVNKGLGFEANNLDNQDHVYSKLSDEHKSIMLNARETLIEFIIKLAEKLIDDGSNDTIILILISRILSTGCSTFGMFPSEFEQLWKSHFVNKSTIQNKLILKKYPRDELIKRVTLQYSYRCFHLHTTLNDLDFKAINLLVNLSINSMYEIVRQQARIHLFELLAQFPYSAMTILPNIIKFLTKAHTDKKYTSQQLEGCLLLLKGNNIQTSMLVKQNWYILAKLWPVLFKCRFFNNESIHKLLDRIYFNANLNFNSFDNQTLLSSNLLTLVADLWPDLRLEAIFSNESARLKSYHQKRAYENQLIAKLMNDLVDVATDPHAMWKNQEISLFTLIFLFNSCERTNSLLTSDCVEVFVNSLVHENFSYRKIGLDGLCIILKITKPKKEYRTYLTTNLLKEVERTDEFDESLVAVDLFAPGYREDNSWHLYDKRALRDLQGYNENSKWNDLKFLDKAFWGYYCWPEKIKITENRRHAYGSEKDEKSELSNFADAVKPIRDKFQHDQKFLSKFIEFSLVEEAKGNEKFDKRKVYLFKSLFRNFGGHGIIDNLFGHLRSLIDAKDNEKLERSHKLAAEMVSGLIKGSKYWPLANLQFIWHELESIFSMIIDNATNDTIHLWTQCLSTGFEDKDPRRMVFYVNLMKKKSEQLFDDLSRSKAESGNRQKSTSLKQANFLQLVACMNQFEWRIPAFWSDLVYDIYNQMDNSSKTIRELLPTCALLSVVNDVDYSRIVESNQMEDATLRSYLKDLKTLNTGTNLNRLVSLVEERVKHSIELYTSVNSDKNSDSNRKELQRNKIDELLSSANFFQTFLNWLILYSTRSLQPLNLQIVRLIPLLCKADKLATFDQGLKVKLATVRMFLAIWSLDKTCILALLEQIYQILDSEHWQSRTAGLQILKSFSVFNIFLLDDETKATLKDKVVDLLCDEQSEVRHSACLTLTGLIHSNFVQIDSTLVNYLKRQTKSEIRMRDPETGRMVINQANLIQRHGALLGLCAVVNASPYDVPSYLPDIVEFLCYFLHDPLPIQGDVKKCLSEFRRTHQDNWEENKLSFTQDQLSVLSDALVSPSYYI